ncbi:MAG: M14 family metallocarboxypeptidase [Mangrovimonas sp.]|nr:M14 family metallocarboxypeptidase [Mangrovimonas sp.]
MTKRSYIVLTLILCSLPVLAQLNPQSKKVTERYFPDADSIEEITPALQKKRGFTNYDELINFITQLQVKHPKLISISYIGESQKGKKIPLVRLTNPDKTDKTRVWMQGGLHGNEPASTEGVLYLLYQLLSNPKYTYLLDTIDLAVVPMANIDGYEKQSRYAANGLDLNRDQTKIMAPETVALKQAFSNFNPEVGVDFHEYNAYRRDFAKMGRFGITTLYDIMFLYTGNLNVPENMRRFTNTVFVNNARKALDTNGLRYHDYMTTGDYMGDTEFNLGSIHARSSATSYALTNAVSTLIEVRGVNLGRTSFKRRIATTFIIGLSYLETAYHNQNEIKEEIAQAEKTQPKITVTSVRKEYKDTIQVIDLDTYETMALDVTIHDALQSSPKLVRSMPLAYIISADQEALIEKLHLLGITTETLSEPKELTVEAYQITAYDNKGELYEKMNRQTVETQLETKTMTFPAGTYFITTNQKNTPLLCEVLEPEAPNSFVNFGVLKTDLNNELPIYRLSK